MLTATLLEPHVSLYQSYLGKAYYEHRRFPEGLAALATAKRLDPRDPTPWLYSSFYLRDQSRPVEALRELNEAIARNDFRAVYRSRLLLDRDLATKNISLAQVYKQLGFVEWAAFEALRSIETDFANSSARLFLADAYVDLPDRLEAARSELLHHQLYAPVNRNSFNNFAEYTGLFERASIRSTLLAAAGNGATRSTTLDSEGGNNHIAFSGRGEFIRAMDARPERDFQWTASGSTKVAFGPSTDLFFSAFKRNEALSEDVLTADVFGLRSPRPIIITLYDLERDANITQRRDVATGQLGLKHFWTATTSVAVTASYEETISDIEDIDAQAFSCIGFATDLDGARVLKNDQRRQQRFSFQGQHVSRIGSHQLMAGAQMYRLGKKRDCREQLFLRSAPVLVDDSTEHSSGDDRLAAVFAYDEFQVTSWLHLSAGVRFQSVTYDDEDKFLLPYTIRQADPAIGATIRLSRSTVVRAAALRNVNGGLVNERLAPAAVAGFAIEQNEVPTTARKEINVAVEHSRRRAFVAGQAFVRHRLLDVRFNGQQYLPDAAAELKGVRTAANLIVSRRLGLSATAAVTRSDTFAYRRQDIETTGGINFIHERRFSASLGGVVGWQRFSHTTYPELRDASFASANASAAYEFPRKRGNAFISATNVFENRIPVLIDLFALPAFSPGRSVTAGINWQF